MNPGPELDKVVLEAMGYLYINKTWGAKQSDGDFTLGIFGEPGATPQVSTDLPTCMKFVWPWLKKNTHNLILRWSYGTYGENVHMEYDGKYDNDHFIVGETEAHSLCLTALRVASKAKKGLDEPPLHCKCGSTKFVECLFRNGLVRGWECSQCEEWYKKENK